ncbi:hypothetical protein J3459_014915 [Metarhizium acridum]|nr:hypothetical protein J3459_014915 [Metarhizium acridum]
MRKIDGKRRQQQRMALIGENCPVSHSCLVRTPADEDKAAFVAGLMLSQWTASMCPRKLRPVVVLSRCKRMPVALLSLPDNDNRARQRRQGQHGQQVGRFLGSSMFTLDNPEPERTLY